MDDQNRCMRCMGQKDSQQETCPACGFSEKDFVPEKHHLQPHTILKGQYLWGVRWARAASASLTSAGICSCISRLRLRNIFPPASSFAIRDSTRSACSRGRMKNPSCRGAAASSARRRRSRNSITTSALCPSKTAFWKTERRISSWSTSPASIWAPTRSCTAAS